MGSTDSAPAPTPPPWGLRLRQTITYKVGASDYTTGRAFTGVHIQCCSVGWTRQACEGLGRVLGTLGQVFLLGPWHNRAGISSKRSDQLEGERL